jgi:hypothetical protein
MTDLKTQVAAIERAVCNLRGDLARLRDMERMKRADPTMVHIREDFLKDLTAAQKTMQWLLENEEKIRAALRRP